MEEKEKSFAPSLFSSASVQLLREQEYIKFFNEKIFEKLGISESFDFKKNNSSLLSLLIQLLKSTDDLDEENSRLAKIIWIAAHLLFCCQFDNYQTYFQEWVNFLLDQEVIDEFLLLETYKLHAEILALMGKRDQLSTFDVNIWPSKGIKIYGLEQFNQRIEWLKKGNHLSLDFYASLAELKKFFDSNTGARFNRIGYQDAVCSLFVKDKLFQEIEAAEQRYAISQMTWEEQCKNQVKNLQIKDIFSAFEAVCSIYSNYSQIRSTLQESNGQEAIVFKEQPIEIDEFFVLLIERLKDDNALEEYFSFYNQSYNVTVSPEVNPRFIGFLSLLVEKAPKIIDGLSSDGFLGLFYWLTAYNYNLKEFDKSILEIRKTLVTRRFAGITSKDDYKNLIFLLDKGNFYCAGYENAAVEGLRQAAFQFNQEDFNDLLKCQFENKRRFCEVHLHILLSINPDAFFNAYEKLNFDEKQILDQSYKYVFTQYIKDVPLLEYFQRVIPEEIAHTADYQRQCAIIANLQKGSGSLPWFNHFADVLNTLLFSGEYEAAKKIVLVCMIVADLTDTPEAKAAATGMIKEIIQNKNNPQPQTLYEDISTRLISAFGSSPSQLNDKDFLIEPTNKLAVEKTYGLAAFQDYVEILGCFTQKYKDKVNEESLPNQLFLSALFEAAISRIENFHEIFQLTFVIGDNLFLQNFLCKKWIEKQGLSPLEFLQCWLIEFNRAHQDNNLDLACRMSVLELFLRHTLAERIKTLNLAGDVSDNSLYEYKCLARIITEISTKLAYSPAIHSQLETLSKSIFNHLSVKLLDLAKQFTLSQDTLDKYAAVYPGELPITASHYVNKFKQAYNKAQAAVSNVEKLELIADFQHCCLARQELEQQINEKYEILKKKFTKDVSDFSESQTILAQKIKAQKEQLTQWVTQQSVLRKSFELAIGEVLGVFPSSSEWLEKQKLLIEGQTELLSCAEKTGETLNQQLENSEKELALAQESLETLTISESTFSIEAAKKLFNNQKACETIAAKCCETFETFQQQVQLLETKLHVVARKIYNNAADILKEKNQCLENLNNQSSQIKNQIEFTTKNINALTLAVNELTEKIATDAKTIETNTALYAEKDKALIEKCKQVDGLTAEISTLFTTEKLGESLSEIKSICENAIQCRELIQSNLEHTFIYWLAELLKDAWFESMRAWSQEVFIETEQLKNDLEEEMKKIRELKEDLVELLPDDANITIDANIIRDQLVKWQNEKKTLSNDPRIGLFRGWSVNWTLNGLESITSRLLNLCRNMSQLEAEEDTLFNETEALDNSITLLKSKLPETQNNLRGKQEEAAKLESEKPDMVLKASEITAAINQLEPVVSNLEKVSLPFYALLSPSWIETLYNSSLTTRSKITSILKLLEKDKINFFSIASFKPNDRPLQQGNFFYHILVTDADANMLETFIKEITQRYSSDIVNNTLENTFCNAITLLAVEQDQEKFRRLASCVHVLLQHGASQKIPILWYAYHNIKGNPAATALFQNLLNHYENVSCAYDEGNTLLHAAVERNDEPIISALLQKGADLSKPNFKGQTPLNQLLHSSHFSLQQKLYYIQMANKTSTKETDNSLSLNYSQVRDALGNTLLHQAIMERNEALIQHLCRVQPCLLAIKNNNNQLPLHLAVEMGNATIVKDLLEQMKSNKLLSSDTHGEVTQALFLSLLADKKYDAVAMDCLKAFFDCVNWRFGEIKNNPMGVLSTVMLNDFLKLETNAYRYLTACTTEDKFNLLLEQGIDPNSYDEERNTALHDAVLKRNLERIKILLSKGAKIDQRNAQGKTPLMALYATIETVNQGDQKVIDYLVDQSMYYSVGGNSLPAVSILQRPVFSLKDQKGLSTLHYAAQCGDVTTLKKFIEKKTFANLTNFLEIRDVEGKTPAHYLVAHSKLNKEEIKETLILLKEKSSLHLRDEQNHLPLHHAVNVDVAEYLIRDYYICNHNPPLTVDDLDPIVERILTGTELKSASIRKLYVALADQKESDDKKLVFEKMKEKLTRAKSISLLDSRRQRQAPYLIKSEDPLELIKQLKQKIIARQPDKVAAILDCDPNIALPENLNRKDYNYFDVMNNQSRRCFWVAVVKSLKQTKKLTFQDRETGYTLLHALVLNQDQKNFATLNRSGGIEYVIEKDKENKTVMTHLRSHQLDTQKENLRYSPQIPANNKSIYQFALESIHLRLKTERDNTIAQTIVAELNFSHLIELEMVLALLKDIRQNQANFDLATQIWQFKDCRGKTIAESLLERLNSTELKGENSRHFQSLLVEFLDVSGIENGIKNGLTPASPLTQLQQKLNQWLEEFKKTADAHYQFGEKNIISQVHKIFEEEIGKKYEKLLEERLSSISNLKFNDNEQRAVKKPALFFPSVEEQTLSQEMRNAKNAAIYLGVLFETLELDQYVTLPTDADSSPLPSLLQATREKGFSELYIEMVARLVEKFGKDDPAKIVKLNQEAEVHKTESREQAFVNEVMSL